jgi:hypothetical protein
MSPEDIPVVSKIQPFPFLAGAPLAGAPFFSLILFIVDPIATNPI